MYYRSETWTFTQVSEKIMNIFERKILRKILGPIQNGETDTTMNCIAYLTS